jgi:hypothetical protein
MKEWIMYVLGYRKTKRETEKPGDVKEEFDRMIDEIMWYDKLNNLDWEEVVNDKKEEKQIRKGKTKGRAENDQALYRPPHNYHLDGNDIKVKIDIKTKMVPQCIWMRTVRNKRLTYLTLDNKAVLMTKVTMFSKELTLVPTHALEGLSMDELDKYHMLNPMIHATTKLYKIMRLPIVRINSRAYIHTLDVNLHDNYVIETTVVRPIDVITLFKGKQVKGTIGVILHVEKQANVIWSGSLVDTENTPMIVSSITEKESGLIIIVAWTVCHHDIHAYIT